MLRKSLAKSSCFLHPPNKRNNLYLGLEGHKTHPAWKGKDFAFEGGSKADESDGDPQLAEELFTANSGNRDIRFCQYGTCPGGFLSTCYAFFFLFLKS